MTIIQRMTSSNDPVLEKKVRSTTWNSGSSSVDEEVEEEEEEEEEMWCLSDRVASVSVALGLDSLRYLCLADCLEFYQIVGTILSGYAATTSSSKSSKSSKSKTGDSSRRRRNDDDDDTFVVSYLMDDVVIASVCRLFECGIEHLDLICGDSGSSTATNAMEQEAEKKQARRHQGSSEQKCSSSSHVFALTTNVVRLLLSWSKSLNIRVASSAMTSLSIYGHNFPTEEVVLSLTSSIRSEKEREKQRVKLRENG